MAKRLNKFVEFTALKVVIPPENPYPTVTASSGNRALREQAEAATEMLQQLLPDALKHRKLRAKLKEKAQVPRFRDQLARLVFYAIPERQARQTPSSIIGALGRMEREHSDCAGTLRAYADEDEYGQPLDPLERNSYYNKCLVHWWHKGKPKTATHAQIGERIKTAIKRHGTSAG